MRSVGSPELTVRHCSHEFEAPSGGVFSARRRQPVLSDVSFTVPAGTLTALLGPSGCGKSTLLRALAGLLVPSRGEAQVADRELIGNPGGVAYHPQQDSLLPWLRVIDNAMLGAEVSSVRGTSSETKSAVRDRAMGLLDRFGLGGLHHAWPDELSGGMRQRVALLRTFLMPQPALALDEPFGALDAITRRKLQHWLLEIIANEQRPTLLVTHDIDEALLLADQILVFSGRPGSIIHVEDRPAAELRKLERVSGADRAASMRLLAALGVSH
ncbi:ATP-binding cassette domain-containing protein [Leucobacter sp. UT-8R-CII-1-4]|uniref:ABC transporter ATP-binding protein n=1 Tax=Leucobacter sp. UT-8R-CII-1-4 TaxID=3040075 RepID=UPI0024A8390D|nr:ATP-binding cassette domain-containing protein [Leucobacter sp. UT-8R-CII-1-4]MDI6023073.1 ATP-binding cassette domain-containing protein [Leucobacter sp. UT-8R-CII-1-4]